MKWESIWKLLSLTHRKWIFKLKTSNGCLFFTILNFHNLSVLQSLTLTVSNHSVLHIKSMDFHKNSFIQCWWECFLALDKFWTKGHKMKKNIYIYSYRASVMFLVRVDFSEYTFRLKTEEEKFISEWSQALGSKVFFFSTQFMKLYKILLVFPFLRNEKHECYSSCFYRLADWHHAYKANLLT